jgi:hypothetical protein
MANSSRQTVQTPSERAAQAIKPERVTSGRYERWDYQVGESDHSAAETTNLLQEIDRLTPRGYQPPPQPQLVRMIDLAPMIVAMPRAFSVPMTRIFERRYNFDQRDGAMYRLIATSEAERLTTHGKLGDLFSLSADEILVRSITGELERMLDAFADKPALRILDLLLPTLRVPGRSLTLTHLPHGGLDVQADRAGPGVAA